MGATPTEQLRDDHDMVLAVVGAMEREVASIARSRRVNTERVVQMVDFTKDFTDGCHHAKEERLLFPLLERRNAAAGGPVSVMLSEHEAGRQATRAIDQALPEAGENETARAAVAENLALYANLLRLHINKENTVLFPLADRILSVDDQKRLTEEFARVDHEDAGEGGRERYHEMAHQLAQAGQA